MAERGRSQTASSPALASQPRSRVSRESPQNRAVVRASAPRLSSPLRRREDPATDPRSGASRPSHAARDADADRANLPPAWDCRDARGPGCPHWAGHAGRPPAPPTSGVRGAAAGASVPLAAWPAHRRGRQSLDSYPSQRASLGRGATGPRRTRILAGARLVAQPDRALVQRPGAAMSHASQSPYPGGHGGAHLRLHPTLEPHGTPLPVDLQRLSTPSISGSRTYGTLH